MALDSAKGRDTEKYKEIVAQLRASYKRCGAVCIYDLCTFPRVDFSLAV